MNKQNGVSLPQRAGCPLCNPNFSHSQNGAFASTQTKIAEWLYIKRNVRDPTFLPNKCQTFVIKKIKNEK
jgi:hypothetical protein